MKITCDKCDTQIELDEDPGQLKDSTIRCPHCNALLDVAVPTVERVIDLSARSGSDMRPSKPPKEKMEFLRTDMPGKKRKKKNASESLKADHPKRKNGKKQHPDPAGTMPSRMDAAELKSVGDGLPEKDDAFDFLMDEEEHSGAGDMVNEKTEVLGIDDIDFKTGEDDSARGSDLVSGGDPAIDKDLFLDFDLEGLGLDADAVRGIDGADDTDALDGMEPFALDLDEEFSADSDDETIILDLDLDGRSERFRPPATEKKPVDAVSKSMPPGISAGSFSDEPVPVSADLDGRFGAAGKDGLLDLFLELDHGQKSGVSRSRQFPEDVGLMKIEDDAFFVEGEDPDNLPLDLQSLKKELDATGGRNNQEDFLEFDLGMNDTDKASSSEDVGLGLDENLLLDLDLDFEEDEHGLTTVAADNRAEAVSPEPVSGGSAEGAGLETDENLFLDLDLDLDLEGGEDGPATAAMDKGDSLLRRDPVMEAVSDDEGLLEDLDLDFEEDDHGLATVVADGDLKRDPDAMPDSEDAELVLDDDLLLDLDFAEDKEMSTEEAASEDDPIALVFDLDEENPQKALESTPGRDEEFSLELDLGDEAEEISLSGQDGVTPELDLNLEPVPEAVSGAGEPVSGGEDEFSLELDLGDEAEEISLSEQDGVAPELDLNLEPLPEAVSGAGEPASGGEDEFSLELDLGDEAEEISLSDQEGGSPLLDLELSPEDVSEAGEPLPDAEEDFSLELDLEDSGEDALVSEKVSDVPQLDLEEDLPLELDEAEDGVPAGGGAGHADARESEADEILKAVDGDSESEEEFLFNMELEKFEEAHDELETAQFAEHADADGGTDPGLKSAYQDEPENFEVVEEILLSSDHDSKTKEPAHRDEEFIDAFDMGIPTHEFEELNENRPEDKKAQRAAVSDKDRRILIAAGAPAGRKRFGLSVLILVLALLGALLFGAFSFGLFEGFNARNILHKIPFLKDHVTAPLSHAGEIVALENTIKNRFVENNVVGTLFVITGKVRNDFPGPRSYIEVVGRLFSPGKKNAGNESVYCGNTLTDQELTTLPSSRIKDLLRNKAGKNNSNVNVPSGKVLPYMIVFDNLPGTLEEFAVTVKGSLPTSG